MSVESIGNRVRYNLMKTEEDGKPAGGFNEVTIKAGGQLSNIEANLLDSYSLPAGQSKDAARLLEKMGYTDVYEKDANGNIQKDSSGKAIYRSINAEVAQTLAQSRYEQSQRAFSALQRLLSNAHQIMMRAIQALRV